MHDETVRPAAASFFDRFEEQRVERRGKVSRERLAQALIAAGYSRERVEQYLDGGPA